jgi:hypothetical protein
VLELSPDAAPWIVGRGSRFVNDGNRDGCAGVLSGTRVNIDSKCGQESRRGREVLRCHNASSGGG